MLAALEVSTRLCSVALLDLDRGREISQVDLPSEQESSVTLIPALKSLLEQKGLGPRNLSAVAVATGPGSFTGIRVGLATAEGLCLPSALPAFGIPTLEGLAENLREAGLEGEALCLLDAQREELFVGQYRVGKNGVQETAPVSILGLEKLRSLLPEKGLVVGPGALKYEKEIKENLPNQILFAPAALHVPKAISIARLAFLRWQQGSRPQVQDLRPFYLRLPAVEEKQGKP